ncbi:MAG: hypothetical protein AAB588_04400 [Patescibacteria group bacterium]
MKYVITYDLNKSGQDYGKLIGAIKELPCIAFLKSAWFIKSTLSAEKLYKHFQQFIDKNDGLLVAEINQNRQGWLDQTTWDFLNS